MAAVQLGHLFGAESEAGVEAVLVSVAGSMTVSSWGHGAVEEPVPVTDHGSL